MPAAAITVRPTAVKMIVPFPPAAGSLLGFVFMIVSVGTVAVDESRLTDTTKYLLGS